MSNTLTDMAARLVELAGKNGAAHADALAVNDTGDAVAVRGGKVESVEREDARGVGLRAFVDTADGPAFASASTSDVSDEGLTRLAGQVVTMARISAADPDAVPPVGADHPDLDQLRQWKADNDCPDCGWTLQEAIDAAIDCEAAARGYSDKISNSEGAEAGFGTTHVAYAASDGFAADYVRSSAGLSVSVIAGENDAMQRDYAWHRMRLAEQLRTPEDLGHEAARRAVARLHGSSMKSGRMPIIFEPRIAASLLGHLTGAINGRAVLQQRSFLADSDGEQLFPEFITITDDPDHPAGMGNRLFDGEGTRCEKRNIIDQGRLTGFLADRYAAKRLGIAPTGHARRGLTGDTGIGTSNLILHPGTQTPAEIMREIGHGLLVTELIGFGVNGVTGDYSRGAAGFLIENGEITRPVQEITIAGNLKDMFAGISHLGSDFTWFGASAVPTVAIDGMTIAGQ
jgi:PmbA protein